MKEKTEVDTRQGLSPNKKKQRHQEIGVTYIQRSSQNLSWINGSPLRVSWSPAMECSVSTLPGMMSLSVPHYRSKGHNQHLQ